MIRKIIDSITRSWWKWLLNLAIGGLMTEVGIYWHSGKPDVLKFAIGTFSFTAFMVVLIFIGLVVLAKFCIKKIVVAFNDWFDRKLEERLNKRK
ncbi:hypothetical protein [uncultured Brevibacillus sp.]|uniref:hypothetical protein n=1 Tax=uncultured Brevibacillus sp. TaxID=169970 RepID=UPI002599E3E6|nr:hypothetical protein [uncultured Brevibacillus sp.]